MKNVFSQRTVINIILIAAFISFGILGLFFNQEIKRLETSNVWVAHTHQVIETIMQSQLDLNRAETQLNQSILSKTRQNTQTIMVDVEQTIGAAQQLTRDNPDQQQRLQKLSLLSNAKRLSLQGIIRMQAVNQSNAIQRMNSPQERASTLAMAQLYTEMIQHEQRLLTAREESVRYNTKQTMLILISVTVSTECLLLCCLLLLNSYLRKRNQAEKNLTLTLDNLNRSNVELEQFAYVASHDLQEPLRMVVSYTQLLERRYKDKLDTDATEFINYAVDGAKRMQILLNNLLLYSRINRRELPFELTDFNAIYNDTLLNLDVILHEKKAMITHDEFPSVVGDRVQLTQLLQNLISNALKFIPDDRVPTIHISALRAKNVWTFSVSDNGIGIEPQYFDKIFIIFKRLHTRTDYPGTGIGLALCKKIVERHGGRIWLKSIVDKGTTFYFTLPNSKE